MTMTINGSTGLTFNDGTSQSTSAFYGGLALRNRIINGAMMIDQRNAGASVTPTTDGTYTLDRWVFGLSQASKFSVQKSSTAPTGFVNSLAVTSLSSYTVGASENFRLEQKIEAFNVSDLGWGTADAKTVTLSFWVRSSLTGTFGGSVINYNATRSYPFSYTISSANTFEYKTVTIAGDTSGSWYTNNNLEGIRIIFGLGVGSSVSGTAGSWSGSTYLSATGATSVVGTNGATFYITGVQLEKGSTATSFDYRPYGTELALCQRYYQTRKDGFAMLVQGPTTGNNTYISSAVPFIVTMRSSPTMTFFDRSNTSGQITILTSTSSMNGTDLAGPYGSSATSDYVLAQTFNEGTRYGFRCGFTASAEL